MERLIDALDGTADFFVEHVQITAIVFDNTDDVTVWATTFLDESLRFFHLGLQFQALDLLLRLAGPRAESLQEEVADALATVTEWPCLLEYNTTEHPPVPLPGVALKLSCTYSVEELFEVEEDGENESSEPEMASGGTGSEEEEEDREEFESGTLHNVFYLEDVFLRIEP